MNPRKPLETVVLLASALLAMGDLVAPAGAASSAGEARVYALSFSAAPQALSLVREPCVMVDPGCRITIVKDNVLSVLASPEAQATVADLLRRLEVPPRSQTFQIMILAAGMESEPAIDLPQGAARALAGSGRLLPYKGYRLIDQGLLTTTGRGKIALGDSQTGFEAELKMEGGAEPGSPVLVRSFELTRAKWESVGQTPFRRSVIDTSFTIEPGGTVVLGASRLEGGDQALVVLITAVAGA
jgi:hypothetical protein